MWRRLIYFSSLHFHFVTQGIAFEFKGARGGHHARVIVQCLAHKMDSHQILTRFDRTDQDLTTTTTLDVDQLQVIVFETADKTAFPMGFEPFSLPIVTLLSALFIRQRFFVAAREDEC